MRNRFASQARKLGEKKEITMKTLNQITLTFLIGVLSAPLVRAQGTYPGITTLSAAMDDSSSTFTVASATGFTANGGAYVDNEYMRIRSVSGTTITALRGLLNTKKTAHVSGSTIYAAPANYFGQSPKTGACTSTTELVLPFIDINTGTFYYCDAGTGSWKRSTSQAFASLAITGVRPAAAATATAATDVIAVTGGVGGAQLATTGNGAAGGRVIETGGAGGAGGTSTGTGGAGGAILEVAGAGGGTITGGTGGAATLGAGAGGAGSTAGGTGGGLNLYSGAAGSGGTGTDGAVNIRSGGAAGTAHLAVSTAGAVGVTADGTNQSVSITPSGSGTVRITGGTDPTKVVSIDAAGNGTGIVQTLAFAATAARTATFPDAAITVSGATATNCGVAAGACTTTVVSPTLKIVMGTATSTSATPSTVAITGMPAFTATTSYQCYAANATTVANVFAPLTAGYVSTTAVTFTGPNSLTDIIRWTCVGY